MKTFLVTTGLGAILVMGILGGCSSTPKAPDVSASPAAQSSPQAGVADGDQAIANGVGDVLKRNGFEDIKYSVKDGVVTLTGDVDNQIERDEVKKEAASVPNVHSVVDQLHSFR